MLTQEDLKLLAQLVHTEVNSAITASEERMKAYTEQAIGNAITASEERMKNHMNAVIETQVMPQIKQIADGHLQISEQLQRIEQRLDSLEETVTAHEWYIVRKVSGES